MTLSATIVMSMVEHLANEGGLELLGRSLQPRVFIRRFRLWRGLDKAGRDGADRQGHEGMMEAGRKSFVNQS